MDLAVCSVVYNVWPADDFVSICFFITFFIIPQYYSIFKSQELNSLNWKIILMAPVKNILSHGYHIQIERSDVYVVGPQVLDHARSNPEMVIEFLSLYQMERLHLMRFCLESDCENCKLQLDFYRRHKVQLRELYRDMRYARWNSRGEFLVTTGNTGNSNNLVAFSVKLVPSPHSLLLAEEQIPDIGVKISVPSVWELHEQSDSMPPLLYEIVEEIINKHTSVIGTFVGSSRVFGDRFSSLSSPTLPIYRDGPDEIGWHSIFLNVRSLIEDALSHQRTEVNKPLFNRARSSEAFLMIAAQTGLACWAIGSNGTASLSKNARILLYSAVSCNVISFLCYLYGILVFGRRKPTGLGTPILTGIGYTASVYGFLALTGMLMPENFMLGITFGVCLASLPALAHAFMKS
ncbi:hypothetical protein Patl1_26735 [Pistacia atlantica]|uniref:Uncharacterized protein n=1 Tax=Pistacia atlantica TaxID=434234 RepID=A0ACC1B0U4_9ROSI|nr:hypothetical protein Patl1_26735 [Pistacia atlantica]